MCILGALKPTLLGCLALNMVISLDGIVFYNFCDWVECFVVLYGRLVVPLPLVQSFLDFDDHLLMGSRLAFIVLFMLQKP